MTSISELPIEDVTDYYQQNLENSQRRHRKYMKERHGKEVTTDTEILRAERQGPNVLILKYTGDWVSSIDGTRTKHKLIYHWLSSRNAELCEVQGSETIVTKKPDLSESLFDQYQLFC